MKSYLGFILAREEGGRLSETLKAILLLKAYQEWFLCYHLPRCFEIFISVFASLHVKVNSQEICVKISFPSFLQKNADVIICFKIQG